MSAAPSKVHTECDEFLYAELRCPDVAYMQIRLNAVLAPIEGFPSRAEGFANRIMPLRNSARVVYGIVDPLRVDREVAHYAISVSAHPRIEQVVQFRRGGTGAAALDRKRRMDS